MLGGDAGFAGPLAGLTAAVAVTAGLLALPAARCLVTTAREPILDL